jgi:tRNA(His) 5'-end guanylyltransferase
MLGVQMLSKEEISVVFGAFKQKLHGRMRKLMSLLFSVYFTTMFARCDVNYFKNVKEA